MSFRRRALAAARSTPSSSWSGCAAPSAGGGRRSRPEPPRRGLPPPGPPDGSVRYAGGRPDPTPVRDELIRHVDPATRRRSGLALRGAAGSGRRAARGHQGVRAPTPWRRRPRPGARWSARTTPRSCWPRPTSRRAGVAVHFIGRLQSNKVRLLAPVVSVWESRRAGLARSTTSPGGRRAPTVLIQVNATGEAGKGGCAPGRGRRPRRPRPSTLGLRVDGLMTIGPTDGDADGDAGGLRARARASPIDLGAADVLDGHERTTSTSRIDGGIDEGARRHRRCSATP